MPERVAVVIQRMGADGEIALQGLRTTLSLSLGDRQPDLYLLGAGVELITAPRDSELGRALAALHDELGRKPTVEGIDGTRSELLGRIRRAAFQQSF